MGRCVHPVWTAPGGFAELPGAPFYSEPNPNSINPRRFREKERKPRRKRMRDLSAGEVDAPQYVVNKEGNPGEVARANSPLKTRANSPAVPTEFIRRTAEDRYAASACCFDAELRNI